MDEHLSRTARRLAETAFRTVTRRVERAMRPDSKFSGPKRKGVTRIGRTRRHGRDLIWCEGRIRVWTEGRDGAAVLPKLRIYMCETSGEIVDFEMLDSPSDESVHPREAPAG